MKDKMYLVKYSTGSYDDFYQIEIFVTHDTIKAEKYIEKFNTILNNWKDFIKKYENDGHRDETKFVDEFSNRYWDIKETNHAFIEEIEVR